MNRLPCAECWLEGGSPVSSRRRWCRRHLSQKDRSAFRICCGTSDLAIQERTSRQTIRCVSAIESIQRGRSLRRGVGGGSSRGGGSGPRPEVLNGAEEKDKPTVVRRGKPAGGAAA